MRFRPCIDIHNGKVKQIVGGSLRDEGDRQRKILCLHRMRHFCRDVSERRISGGHVILLNAKDSPFYEKTKEQAMLALRTYPGGLQVGGGITDENAKDFLEAGASHVIITSFVFKNGVFLPRNLEKLLRTVGKEHLVLDLSCRRKEDGYSIVTDRWQKFTDVKLSEKVLDELSGCCDEFLVHAVDAEGKAQGIERELADMLGRWQGIPVTYAGGVGSFADLQELKKLGRDHIDVTIGSALDLFGGSMPYREVLRVCAANLDENS